MVVAAFLILIAAMIGTAVPSGEGLSATWTGSVITTKAWNFHIPNGNGDPQWYQVRYYPPGEFDQNHPEAGTYFTNPPFAGLATYTESNPYIESFTPDPLIQGTWVVALFKDGRITAPPEEIISPRGNQEVPVPIPEFPTIALPIATAIGLMFIIHNKRRKEEEG